MSFAGHFENTIVPYRRPPKLHFANFHINYPLDLLQEHGCEKCKCIFKFFATRLSLFNEYECIYGTTYEYIHTYIHTDTACVQHVNVGLAQARPNNSEGKFAKPHPCIVFTLVCNCNVGIGLCKFTFTIISSLPWVHAFWHAIPTSFYIFNVF